MKNEKSAKKIVILDFCTGKVFIRSIPLEMIELDASEIVENMSDDLGISENDCQYMVVHNDDFISNE